MSDQGLTYRYPNVSLGPGAEVDPFVLLGRPPRGVEAGALPLIIGAHAIVRSHTVIYAGAVIGDDFQAGHGVLIREHTTIGDCCSIGSGSVIEFRVRIGNGVRLHSNVFVPEYSTLEDGCWVGPNVVLTNAKYPLAPGVKENLAGPHIGRHAKVGANSTLLPGVRIGEGALVGAGAVVTKDVPPGAVVAGNPARVMKTVAELPYGEEPHVDPPR